MANRKHLRFIVSGALLVGAPALQGCDLFGTQHTTNEMGMVPLDHTGRPLESASVPTSPESETPEAETQVPSLGTESSIMRTNALGPAGGVDLDEPRDTPSETR